VTCVGSTFDNPVEHELDPLEQTIVEGPWQQPFGVKDFCEFLR